MHEVLIVDDLPEIAAFFGSLERRLGPLGVHLRTETDPAKAIQLIREHKYDLVVSDFRMDQFDGVEVLRAARKANPSGGRILMTGYTEIPTPIARIQEASVDAYVQKPLRVQDITLLMLDFLHHNERAIQACREAARDMETLAQHEEAT